MVNHTLQCSSSTITPSVVSKRMLVDKHIMNDTVIITQTVIIVEVIIIGKFCQLIIVPVCAYKPLKFIKCLCPAYTSDIKVKVT